MNARYELVDRLRNLLVFVASSEADVAENGSHGSVRMTALDLRPMM
jgi:hypothetical protein